MSAAPTEYVYSPPSGRMNHIIGQPKYNNPTTSTTSVNNTNNGLGGGAVVVRTPLDASILEQQMRMFMKEKRGGASAAPAEDSKKGGKSSTAQASYFSFGPNGAPAEVSAAKSKPMNVIRPGKKGAVAPVPTGPNRNTILPTDVPAPPKMSERPMPSLPTGSPAIGLKRSPVVGRGASIRAGAHARKASPLMQEGITASPVPTITGRARSNTDAGVTQILHVPAANESFRPRVPEKDVYPGTMPRSPLDHTRSRSLSPPPVAAAPKKDERKRNVFGLFPSSEAKNPIATIFQRKPAAPENTPPVVSRPITPTPPPAQQQWTSPPAPYYSRTASPVPSLTHSRDSSRDSSREPSRDSSTTRGHTRTPSALTNQIDIEEAMEKVWGTHGRSGGQAGRALHRAVDASEERDRSTSRSRARTPRKTGLGRQLTNEYPTPSPLLPPVNREVYAKRSLPAAPTPAPAPVVAPAPASPEPVPSLLPVAYCPDDDEEEAEEVEAMITIEEEEEKSLSDLNPLSPGIEPLLPISMQPSSPIGKRYTHQLSVFIPQVGRRLTAQYSAPGTPAEEHEVRYFLELPEGLGDFHLDSAQEADEDDILVWLDSLNFGRQQESEKAEKPATTAERTEEEDEELAQHARFVAAVAARSAAANAVKTPELVIESAPTVTSEVRISAPASPSLIPRKPVASPQASPRSHNRNLLSPPASTSAANSPPSPSNYSSDSAFSGRASYASSIGDAFKYDNYRDTVNSGDWRNAVISEYSSDDDYSVISGLKLRGVSVSGPSSTTSGGSPPMLSSSPNPSSNNSSPQTNPPSTTFSSDSPHFGSYYMAELDGNPIGHAETMKKQRHESFDVYIDGTQSSGLLTAEIEAILAAQEREEEDERERRMETEYLQKMEERRRRTRYVRGRNSEFEGEILFVLRSEDMI